MLTLCASGLSDMAFPLCASNRYTTVAANENNLVVSCKNMHITLKKKFKDIKKKEKKKVSFRF